jgi:hypothetical protein
MEESSHEDDNEQLKKPLLENETSTGNDVQQQEVQQPPSSSEQSTATAVNVIQMSIPTHERAISSPVSELGSEVSNSPSSPATEPFVASRDAALPPGALPQFHTTTAPQLHQFPHTPPATMLQHAQQPVVDVVNLEFDQAERCLVFRYTPTAVASLQWEQTEAHVELSTTVIGTSPLFSLQLGLLNLPIVRDREWLFKRFRPSIRLTPTLPGSSPPPGTVSGTTTIKNVLSSLTSAFGANSRNTHPTEFYFMEVIVQKFAQYWASVFNALLLSTTQPQQQQPKLIQFLDCVIVQLTNRYDAPFFIAEVNDGKGKRKERMRRRRRRAM